MLELNKIYNEDCLGDKEIGTGMWRIPDKSVDMILCDLPYGTTDCKWDSIIPLESLWNEYKRIIKDNCPIVLTASQPFTTELIASNKKWFKYTWIWNKTLAGTGLHAKVMPLKIHEEIIVFGKGRTNYFPQMRKGKPRINKKSKIPRGDAFAGKEREGFTIRGYDNSEGQYYPQSIIEFTNANRKNRIHPTQKPVELFDYLIKTYTNEGDLVLDNCIGSGTTAIACLNNNRNYIGFEKDNTYYNLANERIELHKKELSE